jgi:AcrR family transcriptional regulator
MSTDATPVGSEASTSTRQLLLDTAVRHLEALGWEGTQIPAIVDEVHVARSSVYHFFGSREGLLAAATAERYRRSLLAENTTPVDDAAECSSEQEFLEFITGQLIRVATDPVTAEKRRARVVMGAEALEHEELSAEVAVAQQALVDAMADIVRQAQELGIANPEVDATSYASWLHGMTLGRTLTESSCADPQKWLDVAVPAALAPLRLRQGHIE